MRCPACQHENRDGAKFCEECATPLKRVCASCGSELRPSAKFCDECGTPTAGTASRPQGAERAAQRAEGERSSRTVVTIIFADLVGSTSLHERLDAEAVRQFMDGYYAAMRGAVEAHGGRVTQVMGDGVKAVFGAPRVAEDDAIRAVRAGVEMQRAFRALADEQRGRVGKTGLRVAVNTGEVVSDGETEIIGDPVNVAARLQEQGKDGAVVIGGSTQRIVASLVTLDRLGSFALKGRSEQVEAYRVVSLEPPAATKAAFVGRDEELARLGGVYETAVTKPAAQLAVLLGSPGLGKSRLIDEFVRRLGEGATMLTAHCDASGGATFAPLVAALREHLGIEDGARPEALRASVEAVLPGEDAERARIVGGVVALLSGSPASPEETFFVIRRLLAALAATRPVVLVIDDLHWAESLLLDLVEHLVQWGSGIPLFVLVGARPELRELRSSLVMSGGLVSDVLTLTGLDAGAAMRLAAGVIGAVDLPAALAAKLLATSEGNPLFVGELIKMLVQEGVLHREGERWVASAALADLEMPPTIHALLAARIERLRPEERAVLERAAVVGRHFSKSAVAALLSQTADLEARLEALRRSELIERDTGWFLGEPVLRFHHVLIRDAAYRRVLKGTRAELHARLANWIETKIGEAAEHDETIGWHLEQAHQHLAELGPLDATGVALGERAAHRLAAAGRRALARDDVALAASGLGRALACLPAEASERADLALDWCEALLSAGDVGPAAAALEELERASAGEGRLRAWHTCFAGQLTTLTSPQGLHATAESVAAAAAALAALGDAAGEAKAHFVHAQALARLGKVGACEAALDLALAAARRAGDRRRANAVLAGAPRAALWGPSPVTRASGRCLDVVRVLRITQGAPAVEAVALSCQGVLEALRGRTDAAKRMIASSRKLVEEIGIAHRLFEADVFAGRVALLEGDASAAEGSLRGAYEGLRDLGLGIDAAQAAALLARALLAQGRAAEAEALSHESEALAGDDLQAAIAWRGVRAEALAQRGEHEAAVALAQAAVGIAAATDALLDHADARLALAAALRAAGRRSEADSEERRAFELWEAKGATLLAERAWREGARGPGAAPVPLAGVEPSQRRRVLPNATTRNSARLDAAVAARDAEALLALFSDDMRIVDHTTGIEFGREGGLASWRSLIGAREPACRHEPLATLGDSLGLFRLRLSASGASRGRMDVGAYDKDEIHLVEADPHARRRAGEVWATSHLGDALARLYQRYGELCPDGPERVRAEATARSVGALLGPGDPDTWCASVAPACELSDHRTLGFPSLRGRDAVCEFLRASFETSEGQAFRIDDLLGVRPDAILWRGALMGTLRTSGGAFEIHHLCLTVIDHNGLVERIEYFDPDREGDALACLDELTGGATPKAPLRRRLPLTRATRHVERLHTALESHSLDAIAALHSEQLEVVHHPSGAVYGLPEVLALHRDVRRGTNARFTQEALAALGDSLVLLHRRLAHEGMETRVGSIGPVEVETAVLLEVDEREGVRRSEVFAADRLGNAIARLYERHAELLPEGPARVRAAATARSIAAMLTTSVEQDFAATVAPGFEAVDHRLVGHESVRAEALQRGFDATSELEDERRFSVDDVLALSGDAFLRRTTHSGVVRASGGAFERTVWALTVFRADGRITRHETFDVGQEDVALARFDELTEGAAPKATLRRRVRPNAATRSFSRCEAALAARDDEALARLFDASLQVVHHPSGVDYGRREMLATWRGAMRAARLEFRQEILASLGDALALDRHVTTVEGLSDAAMAGFGLSEFHEISLLEVDARGQWLRSEIFAADRLGDAIVRLYERYAELLPDGAERERAAATARSFAALAGPIEPDRYAPVLDPSVRIVDHRVLHTWSARNAGEYLRQYRLQLELAPDFAQRYEELLALEPRTLLVRQTFFGTAPAGGGGFENRVLGLYAFGADGLLTSAEAFEPDSEADAFARFDALAGGEAVELALRSFENAAARAEETLMRCFNARDWEGVLACTAPELVFDERRRLTRNTADRRVWLEQFRLMFDQPASRFATRLLATRGERLSLHRHEFEAEVAGGGGRLEMEPHFALHEVDRGGRIVAIVLFDLEDEGAAHAELDARWESGEAAGDPQASAWVTEFRRAFARRDWDALPALHAPDQVAHDHRLVGWGTLRGSGAWIPVLKELVALSPDVRQHVDHLRTCERGSLWQFEWRGTHEGGDFETPLLLVVELDDEGRQRRLEVWDPELLEAARARFAEIAACSAQSPFANAATRAVKRGAAAIERRDWTGFAALFAPGFRNFDRTAIGKLEVDREAWLAAFREQLEMTSGPLTPHVLATRGEPLAVVRMLWHGSGGDIGLSELDWLLIIEVDERGDHVAVVSFDPGDLDAAYAELDARYEAHAPAWMPGFFRAVARRDWDAMAGLCAPDLVAEDHRLVSWGTLRGLSAYLPTLRSMVDLAPDVRLRLDHLRANGRAELFEARWLGTRDGGAFEIPVIGVSELDERGKQCRFDLYDLGQLEQARTRFEALAANALRHPPAPLVKPNAASEWLHRFQPVFNARDWDALRALYAASVTYEDRQRLSLLSGGIDMLWSSVRERAEAGARLERVQLLGTAGRRTAIQRLLWAGGGAEDRFEVEHIVVQEVDEAGRLVATINFDLGDTRAAQREAWARWFAADPVAAAVVEPLSRLLDAWNAQDLARLRPVFAHDLVADDHRHTGFGRLEGAAAYLESVAAFWQLASDSQLEIGWRWLALDRHGAITVARRHGALPEGGAFEGEYLYLYSVARGLITRIEAFDLGAAEVALARFEELRPNPLRIPPNASTRANDRWWTLAEAEDWDGVRAFTEGMVFEDRRRLIRLAGGAELLLADTRHLWEAGWRPARTLLATGGERLSLERMLWTLEAGEQVSEIEVLKVAEVDAEGHIVAYLIFDADDRAAASKELFERWVRQGADGVLPATIEFLRAWNAHDLGRMRTLLPSDYVFHDHRRTGIGRIDGAEPYVTSLAALWELSADVRLEMLYKVAQAQHGYLTVQRWVGTNAEGGEFEAVFVGFTLYRGGRPVAVDLFEIDDLDAALARFEELRPDSLRIPENAATRVMDRVAEAFDACDWDAYRALVSDEFRFEDRTRRALVSGDVEVWIASARFLAAESAGREYELLGAVGDRISIDRVVWSGAPDGTYFELERIRVAEVDATGRLRTFILFDGEDRRAAFEEAQARFLTGEAAGVSGQAPVRAFLSAVCGHDWEALLELLAPDFVFDDHRTLGMGVLDREGWVASIRAQDDLTRDLAVEDVRTLTWNRYGRVTLRRIFGTNLEGGPFENVFANLMLCEGDLIRRVEVFDLDDAERAVARFHELCATKPA